MSETRNEKGQIQKGNKLSVRHAGYSFLKSGRVPSLRGKRQIENHLRDLRRALVDAVPKAEDPRKAILIGQIIRSEGFLCLVEAYVRRAGVLRADKFRQGILELQPALSTSVIGLMNLQKAAVVALGTNTREDEKITTALELAREIDAEVDREKVEREGKEGPFTGSRKAQDQRSQADGTITSALELAREIDSELDRGKADREKAEEESRETLKFGSERPVQARSQAGTSLVSSTRKAFS